MVHLIHRKWAPLLHNTVLILCDEGDGLVAMSDFAIRETRPSDLSSPTALCSLMFYHYEWSI